MKTEQEIKEHLESTLKNISIDGMSFSGAGAMANAGYIAALKWVLEDEKESSIDFDTVFPTLEETNETSRTSRNSKTKT